MGRTPTGVVKGKQSQPGRRRWLLPGVLAVGLLAGMATWLLWPAERPLADTPRHQGGPRLAVDREEIDFGTVRFDKMVQARFRVKNVGDQPLQIATAPRVEAVEGC